MIMKRLNINYMIWKMNTKFYCRNLQAVGVRQSLYVRSTHQPHYTLCAHTGNEGRWVAVGLGARLITSLEFVTTRIWLLRPQLSRVSLFMLGNAVLSLPHTNYPLNLWWYSRTYYYYYHCYYHNPHDPTTCLLPCYFLMLSSPCEGSRSWKRAVRYCSHIHSHMYTQ